MRAKFIPVGMTCVVLLLASVLVSGCASGEQLARESTARVSSDAPASSELAALRTVDENVPASGSAIGELISIADIKSILGRDDIVFAVAT